MDLMPFAVFPSGGGADQAGRFARIGNERIVQQKQCPWDVAPGGLSG